MIKATSTRWDSFTYDNFDRLTSWQDASGTEVMNYNRDGSLNNAPGNGLGNYTYTNYSRYVFNGCGGSTGAIDYIAHPVNITYNMFKDPILITRIDGYNSYAKFEYNLSYQRSYDSLWSASGFFNEARYYSEGNIVEVRIVNSSTYKFITYLDGDPYSARVIHIKQSADYWNPYTNGAINDYFYLHRDNQATIIAISNSSGIIAERRFFDAWGNLKSGGIYLTYRGYTGHEHFNLVRLIHCNARLYDPVKKMFLTPDNILQDPYNPQNYNRFGYCLNNPTFFVDADGNILWVPIIVGAVIGVWQGGTLANKSNTNPFEWDYTSGKTWSYLLAGGLIGALSAYVGSSIAASGIPFANTTAIIASSGISSIGSNLYTGGQTDIYISFGFGAYNFSKNEFDFLGKTDNTFLENFGFTFGAIANINDILAGFKPGDVILNTENRPEEGKKIDVVSHSQITKSDVNKPIPLIDWGPESPNGVSKNEIFKNVPATNKYEKLGSIAPNTENSQTINNYTTTIKGINVNRISNISKLLNKGGTYNLFWNNCVNQTSRALNLSGFINIGLHPYLLQIQAYLRSIGFRPFLFSQYTLNSK